MEEMTKNAVISEDQLYRYSLERVWDTSKPTVLFICLNPSTADAKTDDPTVRRMIGFAKQFGFGRLLVGNLFAFRATKPSDLLAANAPIGPENDTYLSKMANEAHTIIAAWGNKGIFKNRSNQFRKEFKDHQIKCLAKNKTTEPKHPLYASYGDELIDL
ncbi:DUF1643 domain-containing protein [uncultured Parasutterella sp.]|uniref:DUF1643 domain-containing protein n=1 Tax=uncultured Parasutterella sp. TaxID=1263098 RepID=UPI0025B6E841|nr:DUF1643 domain-containing protein [uncultured Parasutterella sp.]